MIKKNQLKDLIKHIILEIQKNEMIVNKNYPPDVMGAVNVEEKTNPDGTYSDDMEDGRRSNRVTGLSETEHPPYLINIWWPMNVAGSGEGNSVEELVQIAKQHGALEFAIWTNEDDPKSRKVVVWYDGRTDKPGRWSLKAKTDVELSKKRLQSLKEMTTSSAAGGQEGGTIRVPAWGTKNRLGSPGAIKATKKMKGWKVVKSITDEGK